jgi:hypothetical protein
MPAISIETTDAVELAEFLQFIAGWLDGYLGLSTELAGQPLEGR